MSRPTLLSGFEDIIEYITGLEKRVVELEEENKKINESKWKLRKSQRDRDTEWRKMISNCYDVNLKLTGENKKLKNDLRLCTDGLIPQGMVGGIVECEREKRHKAEEELENREKWAVSTLKMTGEWLPDGEGGPEGIGCEICPFNCIAGRLLTQSLEIKKLKEENEKLQDFSNWENHPALKHKVVMDDDFYLEHLHDGELIVPEEFKSLQEEIEKLKEEKRQTHQFWTCMMDHIDNPDNPDAEYVNEWCESNSISIVDKEALLQAFSCETESEEEEESDEE